MTNYDAQVTRDGKWWMVHVPAINDFTQARRLSEAAAMAAELVAVTLDVDPDEVSVTLHYDDVAGVHAVEQRRTAILVERVKAQELERRVSAEAAALAKDLVQADVPLRDVGTILGVSHQRVHQLTSS